MRRWLLALAVIGIWLWWRHGGETPTHAAAVQAAVLQDGFAVYNGTTVVEIDRKGNRRKQHAFAHDTDLRLVGTIQGPAAGWIRNRKVELVRVSTGKGNVFGKSARMLCEGAATNDERFAVGWLEADEGVWFVHGETRDRRTDEGGELVFDEPVSVETTADRKNWCGIASAGELIALFWRDRDRMFIGTCTRKKCGMAAALAFDRNETLLGFGCLRNACLIAARDKAGKSRLQYVTESGATKWKLPLDTSLLEVSVIGAGADTFAVGYVSGDATHVIRVDRKGGITRLWQGATAKHAPALAWSRNQLLVASGGDAALLGPR